MPNAMSQESRIPKPDSPEISSHAQAVQSWAAKLAAPDFIPTVEQFDALSLAAKHIQIDASTGSGGKSHVTYSDVDGTILKQTVAERVIAAADEKHWHVTADEESSVASILGAGDAHSLSVTDPTAFAMLEKYCVRTGRSVSSSSLRAFAMRERDRLGLSKALEARAAEKEAGVEYGERDRLIRGVAHLITRIEVADPSMPNQNLTAIIDSTDKSGIRKREIKLSAKDLEHIKDLAPEIQAGTEIRAESEQEALDNRWLADNRDEIIRRNRVSYILNGKPRPTKGWKPEDEIKHAERERIFDTTFSPEQQLGIEPLPNGESMPVPTIEIEPLEDRDYRGPIVRPRKEGLFGVAYEVGAALGGDKAKVTRDLIGLGVTGLGGPLVHAPIAAIRYVTGLQKKEEAAAADARRAVLDEKVRRRDASQAAAKERAKTAYDDTAKGYELQKHLAEVIARQTATQAKRELGVKALGIIMDGRDPARELASALQAQRLKITDVLPGFDVDRYKKYKKTR